MIPTMTTTRSIKLQTPEPKYLEQTPKALKSPNEAVNGEQSGDCKGPELRPT